MIQLTKTIIAVEIPEDAGRLRIYEGRLLYIRQGIPGEWEKLTQGSELLGTVNTETGEMDFNPADFVPRYENGLYPNCVNPLMPCFSPQSAFLNKLQSKGLKGRYAIIKKI